MKPSIALLAVLSALSLSACTGTPTEETPVAPQDEPILQQEAEQKPTAPILRYREEKDEYYNEQQELLGIVTRGGIELCGDSPNATAIQALLDQRVANGISYSPSGEADTLEEWLAGAEETLAFVRETDAISYWGGLAESYELQPTRVDEAVISLTENLYSYTGGVHGWGGKYGFTLDVATGEPLTLASLSAEGTDLQAICRQKVLAQLDATAEEMFYWEGYADSVDEIVTDGCWYLNENGIVFVAEQYLIGPYAMGMPEFTVSYAELDGILAEKYQPIPVSEASVTPTVAYADAVELSDFTQVYAVGEEETGGAVLFFDGTVRNVRVSSVCYSGTEYREETNEWEYGYYELDTLFWAGVLPEGSALHLTGEIPELTANRKVCWESAGVRHEGYLTWSGDTGELFLMEAEEN